MDLSLSYFTLKKNILGLDFVENFYVNLPCTPFIVIVYYVL